MRCIHTSKCSFSEGFFPVLIWGYILFHSSPQWAPKYTFAESKTTVLANCSKKGRVEICVMKSHIRKQSLRKLLSSYYVRIFPFHHGPLCAPKYHFPDSTKRALTKCFLKSKYKSVRWSHRSERSFSDSFFHVLNGWNFLYHHGPQCFQRKPFSDTSKTVLIDCSTKHKCNSLRWIHTSPRRF